MDRPVSVLFLIVFFSRKPVSGHSLNRSVQTGCHYSRQYGATVGRGGASRNRVYSPKEALEWP